MRAAYFYSTVPHRVGNAITPQVAAAFMESFLENIEDFIGQ